MQQVVKRFPRSAPWMWEIPLLLFAIALPYMDFMDRSRTSLAVLAGIYVMLGLSLNIVVGYAGLFQLGHAAFFGLGAYTAAILSIRHNITILATIPIAALVAGGAAILVSKPILHLRGDYLCIVTIAFGEIFRIAATNDIFGLTGGANGLFGMGRPTFPLPWADPVPLIVLVLILALYLLMTRKRGVLLQVGGAVLLALAYYVPPRLLDQEKLFVISIAMGIAALVAVSALRAQRFGASGQIAGLIVVLGAFVGYMIIREDFLVSQIDYNLDEYFRLEDPATVLGMELTPVAFKRDARPYYFLVLTFIVITVIGMRRLQDSRLGRAWLYVREDQLAAEAMGIDATQVKLMAFALGSAWAGVAGVLYASRFTVVAPESFNFLQSVIMFCIVVLGGSGSIPGIFVGTLGMVVLPELMRDLGPTFLYEGSTPVVILLLILGIYLLNAQSRLPQAALESGAIAAAFFLPPLLINEPSLYVIGLLMLLVALILMPVARRRVVDARPWIFGALAAYTLVLVIVGGSIGPELESQISEFHIMDWRDGLMGAAMVTMMVLRPAGIIPERRQGIVVSPVVEAADVEAVATVQQAV